MFDQLISEIQNISEGENCFQNQTVYTIGEKLNIVKRTLVSITYSNTGKTIFVRLVDQSSRLPVEIARISPQGSKEVIFLTIQDFFLEYFETEDQAKQCLKKRMFAKVNKLMENREKLLDEVKELDTKMKKLESDAQKIKVKK